MVVRMRATRSHRDNRRSHFALQSVRLSPCEKCGAAKLPHRVCLACGTYRARSVIDVMKKVEKKARKAREAERVPAK
ncbi:MAG: large subunit ribosomal protein L32 [Parcubacteria group bacterium Gr01-1014_72]|nr:MAG: large subunit ribosomal protein L32 [Parcubacteria group bacterium Gr01-1014_72]